MMTFLKLIFAGLLTLPILVIGLYLFSDFLSTVSGEKQRKQEAKQKRKASVKGFTVRMPDELEKPARHDESMHRRDAHEQRSVHHAGRL